MAVVIRSSMKKPKHDGCRSKSVMTTAVRGFACESAGLVARAGPSFVHVIYELGQRKTYISPAHANIFSFPNDLMYVCRREVQANILMHPWPLEKTEKYVPHSILPQSWNRILQKKRYLPGFERMTSAAGVCCSTGNIGTPQWQTKSGIPCLSRKHSSRKITRNFRTQRRIFRASNRRLLFLFIEV